MKGCPRRDDILEAAERLLHHYGPAKTTIAEVAREAGVGVGTVYLEFASKEEILVELSTRRHDGVLSAMQRAARGDLPSFSDRLAAMFDARTKAFLQLADEGARARDLVHCDAPAIRAAHQRFQCGEHALLAGLLREGHVAGEFIGGDADTLGQVLLRAYGSFSPPFLFATDRAQLPALLRATHQLVVYGVLARPVVAKAARPRKE